MVADLALAITQANARGEQPTINLKGFQVGNAWTDAALDNAGAVEFWWTHAIISDDTRAGIEANCDFSKIGPLLKQFETAEQAQAAAGCQDFLSQASADQIAINIYEYALLLCLFCFFFFLSPVASCCVACVMVVCTPTFACRRP